MNAIYAAPELGKTPANHVPLSPISMLKRTAQVHPDQVATIHGDSSRTWAEVAWRCRRLASALKHRGAGKGDTVAVLAPGAEATEDELLEHCRRHLAGFKRPKRVVIDELPKTSTGKIRNNELRDQVRSAASRAAFQAGEDLLKEEK